MMNLIFVNDKVIDWDRRDFIGACTRWHVFWGDKILPELQPVEIVIYQNFIIILAGRQIMLRFVTTLPFLKLQWFVSWYDTTPATMILVYMYNYIHKTEHTN